MAHGLADLPTITLPDDYFLSGELPRVLARFAVAYGPIFKWVVPDGPEAGEERVFLVGPGANRFVLHTARDAFSHALGWTPIVGEMMGHGLLNMDDPAHAWHRRLWSPAFTASAMATYLPIMQDLIAARTRTWPEREVVNVYQEARELTFDIAAAALAGLHTGVEVERLRRLFYILLHESGDDGAQTYDEYLARAVPAQAEMVRLLTPIIAARRAMPPTEQARDVLGMVVRARDEAGRALSDAEVIDHLKMLLVGGHETTAVLASWVLYLLATLPAQRQRVQAEVDAVVGDAPLTLDTLRHLRALDAFIREAGRLYSPGPNLPRVVVREVEFAGYRLPPGTLVRLAVAAGHRLPTVFADPDLFDPDRYAPPREEDKRTPYGLITFSAGPRTCIGINFATVEIKALAAHVLRHYALEAVAGQAPISAGFFIAVIVKGYRLRVQLRGG